MFATVAPKKSDFRPEISTAGFVGKPSNRSVEIDEKVSGFNIKMIMRTRNGSPLAPYTSLNFRQVATQSTVESRV